MEKKVNLGGFKCQALYHANKGVPIVLLHGYSFTTEVWRRMGILDLLAEKKLPFLALDMPYGMKTSCQPRTRNPEPNLAFLAEAIKNFFDSAVPILVGPSLGGHIALMYASRFPVKGLMLISPSRVLSDDLVESYDKFKFPVRIVWGTQDNIVSGEEMRVLSEKLPNAKLVTYEGAGHAAYTSQPDRFKRDLLELYAAAEQT